MGRHRAHRHAQRLGELAVRGASGEQKNLNLSKDDLQQIAEHLGQGKAALVVTADEDELAAVTAQVESLGGKTKKYEIPAEGLAEAQAAIEAESTAA